MVINQGDVFWVDLGDPVGSAPGFRHPHVVIQNNLFNQSRINTVVACAPAILNLEICTGLRASSGAGRVAQTNSLRYPAEVCALLTMVHSFPN